MFLKSSQMHRNIFHNQLLKMAEEFICEEEPVSLVGAYKLLEKIRMNNPDEFIDKSAESLMGEIKHKLIEVKQLDLDQILHDKEVLEEGKNYRKTILSKI